MRFTNHRWVLMLGIALGCAAMSAGAMEIEKEDSVDQIDNATIVQSRGADQSVDYQSLRRFGPWDDRNYELTAADIATLPADDEYRYGVPAFFKILKRREVAAEGYPYTNIYPRELDKEFDKRFGGLLQDGVLHRHGLGVYSHPDPESPPPALVWATDPLPHAVPIIGENFLAIGDEETSIKFNPVDPLKVLAGSNSPSGGQAQNYSTDGGATWLSGGNLPNTCCDPAMEWSADGTVAYAATLIGSSSFRAGLFRSTNGGQTWGAAISVSAASSDKEYIHVDKSPTSPFKENVYLTWHQSNTMFFSRSTDKGVTWATPISFPSAAKGIGSDIATDKAGNIYYVWPSSNAATANVYMVKSTDGGLTFGTPVVVQALFDVYDFPIPAMESRNAFIYVSVDTDRTSGPFANRIYVTYTAMHPSSSNGAAATNHAWIRVVKSDDGGATWSLATTPHSEADIATVDRFHPWMEVDDQGAVHIGFYDTRNSVNRTGIDFYYNYSIDGGVTWLDETRVSSVTSPNITNGQEWGDYNGLAVGPTAAATIWSDNRGNVQHSYVGRLQNLAAGPTYVMNSSGPSSVALCAGQPVPPRTISVQGFSGFTTPVTLSFPGLNAAVFPTATASPNPVTPATPAATSTVNLSTAPGASSGIYPVTVEATNGGATPIVRQVGFSVNLASAAPAAVATATPTNNATGVGLKPTLTWTAVPSAVSYEIQVSTDPAFGTLVDSGTATGTSYVTAVTLVPTTVYYWRVRALNACGNGSYSPNSQFTTGFVFCFNGAVAIPDNNATGATANLAVAAAGTISDLNLSVKISHTYPGDLTLSLSNGTTSVTLGARLGGSSCGVDNIDVTYDDEAATAVTCGATPPGISGIKKPTNPLTPFDGTSLAAPWALKAVDSAGTDVGTIDEFCLMPQVLSDLIFKDGFQ
ncbi:MAG: hypothetical protein ABI411_09185 [Tahibacter sp.]